MSEAEIRCLLYPAQTNLGFFFLHGFPQQSLKVLAVVPLAPKSRMYCAVNRILHSSCFDQDFPTSGSNVTGLGRVCCSGYGNAHIANLPVTMSPTVQASAEITFTRHYRNEYSLAGEEGACYETV